MEPPTEKEVEMAELMTDVIPSLEMVRMVNSGTEASDECYPCSQRLYKKG